MLTQRFLRLGIAASVLALAGCAPAVSSSIGIGSGPSFHLSASPCTSFGTSNTIEAQSASRAFAWLGQISALQAKYSLGHSDVRAQRESWKRVAAGRC
jgi:hypothetical protein